MNKKIRRSSLLLDEKKIFTKGWVFWGTLLGGPLAGFYFISRNFDVLGQKKLSQSIWLWGIIFTIVLFTATYFVPESLFKRVSPGLAPGLTAAVYVYCIMNQGKEIDEYVKNGGLKHSGWYVTGVAILALAISFLFFYTVAMILS